MTTTETITLREHLHSMCGELRDALDDIEFGAVLEDPPRRTPPLDTLLSLLSAARRDGRRGNSLGGGGAPQTIRDELGDAMPPVADPVGEVAVGTKVTDPAAEIVQSLVRDLGVCLGHARVARGRLIEHFTGPGAVPFEGDPGCRVHAAIGEFVAVYRSERCSWCYKFELVEGVEPPVDLLRARAQGKKITPAMIKEALEQPKFVQKPGRKGRRSGRRTGK